MRTRPTSSRSILQAARDVGVDLRQVGSRAYSTNTLESGWIPSPLPGIYTGDGMLAEYRQWLGADSYEANGSIGGSMVSKKIEDYYVNPFELGYGFYIGWKKDFIGKRCARSNEGQAAAQEGHLRVERRGCRQGHRFGIPAGRDAVQVDRLPAAELRLDFGRPDPAASGRQVGMSMFNGYSYNERCMLSLGVVDPDVNVGDVLTLVWGEPDGGSDKTSTERHKQAEIRCALSPTPYSAEARQHYAHGWRSRQPA